METGMLPHLTDVSIFREHANQVLSSPSQPHAVHSWKSSRQSPLQRAAEAVQAPVAVHISTNQADKQPGATLPRPRISVCVHAKWRVCRLPQIDSPLFP